MKLNQQQKDKLLTRLREIWKNKVCDICGTAKWRIDDKLFELREYHEDSVVFGSGAIKPLITMACSNCGNVKIMNAIKLGLISPDTSLSKEKGGDDE